MPIFDETDKIVLTISYIILTIFGSCGNFIVLVSIICRSKARKVQGNVFIVSLALADFLACVLCGPYYLRSLHVEEFFRNKVTQSWICPAVLASAYLLAIESILALTLLSLDRFCAVHFPFWYQKRITRTFCIICTLGTWLISLVTVLPAALIPKWITYENEPGSPCGFQWEKANRFYVGLGVALSFVLPGIITCLTNIFVFKTAREQNRKIEAAIKFKIENFEDSQIDEDHHSENHTSKNHHSKIQDSMRMNDAFQKESLNKKLCKNSNNPSNGFAASRKSGNLFSDNYHVAKNEQPGNSIQHGNVDDNPERFLLSASSSVESSFLKRRSLPNEKSASKFLVPLRCNTRHLSLENLKDTKREVLGSIATDSQILNFVRPLHKFSFSIKQLLNRQEHVTVSDSLNREAESKKRRKYNYRRMRQRSSAKKEMRLALATLSIALCFFLSWFPFVVTRIMKSTGMLHISQKLINYGGAFALLSCCWNPYFVLFTRKEIFIGFKALVKGMQRYRS